MSSIKNRRSRKLKKLAIKKARTQRQKRRERNLRSARLEKQLETVLENANENIVSSLANDAGSNLPNTAANEFNANANTNVNLPYTNKELNTVEPSVGRPSRVLTQKSKAQQAKLKTRLARTLKQKQRERTIRKLRSLKEGEREREEAEPNENVNLNYLYNEPEVWYVTSNYMGDTYYYEPIQDIALWVPPRHAYVAVGEEDEYSREALRKLINKTRKEKLKAKKAEAIAKFEAHPKNRFIIQVEEHGRRIDIDIKTLLSLLDKGYKPFTTLYLVWIDKNRNDSYYYKFQYGRDFENNNDYNSNYDYDNYGYRYRYRRRYGPSYGFNVFKFDILDYFVPNYSYEADDNDYYYGYRFNYDELDITHQMHRQFRGLYSWPALKAFLLSLHEIKEAKKRIETAKVTAPQKLERLQLEGLKRAYSRFEEKTGKDFPVNMQNLLESYLTAKKPVTQYYRERDNLSHINTSLFHNQ